MSIFRSTDPTTWDDVDGIIVNESAPAPNVRGVAANIGILVGQSERGPSSLEEPGGIAGFHELYGRNSSFGMNISLKNKKFGRLKFIRVVASNAVVASVTFDDGEIAPEDVVTFRAKQGAGAYGNNIEVKIEAGSVEGKKYTVRDTNPNTVMQTEVFDNVTMANIVQALAGSKLVTVEVVDADLVPANQDFTPLESGSDGTVADTDYQAAIAKAAVEKAGNVIFLDAYNSTRNGYLRTHVAETQDKMCILAGPESQDVSAVIADVANNRDVDGRIIYAYPWVETVINGVRTFTSPASWYASIITQTAPNIDPAFVENARFLAGVTGLKTYLTRNQFIQLKDAGVSAFERDEDIGFKIKSGIVTQISNSSKVTVLRRRMTDYLTNSAANFLKNYQNAVNSAQNRNFVKGALLTFIEGQEAVGLLPRDSEVAGGAAKLVDVVSDNSDATIAAGFFRIIWRQRLFSSMRFIVLSAEIGESVVVTEAG